MNSFHKVVNPYHLKSNPDSVGMQVFITIRWDAEKKTLSITGVEGPTRGGNAVGGCGQITMPTSSDFARGRATVNRDWTSKDIKKLADVWDAWHLNDIRPGTPAQNEAVKAWRKAGAKEEISDALAILKAEGFRVDVKKPDPYTAACVYLQSIGLYEVMHDGKPYKYGHKWLKEEVPADVLEWLAALPESKRNYAWAC